MMPSQAIKIMKSRLQIVIATLLVICTLPSFALAEVMSSTSYGMESDSINFAGNRSTSTSYTTEDSLGETGTGHLTGSTFLTHAGYQQSSTTASAPTPTPTPSSTATPGNTSGSGSSGSTSFLPNPTNFLATPVDRHIALSWTNPADPYFVIVRVVRSEIFFPTHVGDGQLIYEGADQSFNDGNVAIGKTYYYSIFAVDTYGNHSSGALAYAVINAQGEPFRPSNPFINLPQAKEVHPQIAALTLADFQFIQDGKEIIQTNGSVAIDGDKNLVVLLAYNKVPEILKTIAITLTDPDDPSKVFPFLLRVNDEKTFYSATLGPLGKSGKYGIHIAIMDYNNQGLKQITGDLLALVFEVPAFVKKSYLPIIAVLVILMLILLAVFLVKRNKNSNNTKNNSNGGINSIEQVSKDALSIVLILGLAVSAIAGAHPKFATAAINKEINYQGKLLNTLNETVNDGSYNLRFRLYTASSGGSPLWTETWCYSPDSGSTCNGSGTDSRLTITDGLFSTMLGNIASLSSIDFNQTLYLGVEVGGSAATPSWDGEMTPRKKIGAVPAAFVADTLDNLDSVQFLRTDAENATSTSSTFLRIVQSGAGKIAEFVGQSSSAVLTLLSNGKVGIGTTTPYAELSVEGSSALGNSATAGYYMATTTATSTFVGGIRTAYLDVTGTAATSTFARGIDLAGGCFAINGSCITGGGSGASLSVANTWTALQQFAAGASTTQLSNYGPLYIGGTATTTIMGNNGTSTFSSFISLIAASTTATSTFAGINLPYGGCFAVNGTCLGGGAGAVSSVSNADGTLTISPTTGAVVASLNLGSANNWTALQQFAAGASTTQLSAYSGLYVGTTATTTILGAATSTFGAGVQTSYLNITGTSATSTFANGAIFTGGGLKLNTLPNCNGGSVLETDANGVVTCGLDAGAAGVVTSVSNVDGSLTISPTSGDVVATLNRANANIWTALQQFAAKASTTMFSSFGPIFVGNTATTTIYGDSATSTFSGGLTLSTGNVNVPTGGSFLVNNGLVINSATLGSTVLSSSLTTVGALGSGSITSGFGSIDIGADALTAGAGSLSSLTVSGATTLTGLLQTQSASSTAFSVYNGLFVGGTATTTIVGNNGTSTFSGFISATSASTTATSTLAGVNAITGCIAVRGVCLTSNTGTVTSVDISGASTGLTFTGGPITTSGTLTLGGILGVPNGGTGWAAIEAGTVPYGNGTSALATTTAGTAGNVLALLNGVPTWTATTTFGTGLTYLGGTVTLNTANANIWTALQQFAAGASTTQLSNYGNLYVGGTATTTIVGNSATSTFSGGISLNAGNVNVPSGGNYLANNVLVINGVTLGPTVVSSSLTTVGALDSGSITSNFGSINIGSDALTAGAGSLSSLSVSGTSNFTGLVQTQSASSTASSVYNGLFVGGTATTTIVGNSATSTFSGGITLSAGNVNVPSGSNYLVNNGLVLNSTILGPTVVTSSLTTVGALGSGSITSGFGSIDIGADALTAGAGSLSSLSVSGASTLTGLTTMLSASSTAQSVLNAIYVGRTATTTIRGETNATSTFAGGIEGTYLNITGTSATSTFARGINLSGGCFAINNTCVGGSGTGSGTVNTGVSGYFAYYPSNGTTVDDQTTLLLSGTNIAIGTSTPYSKLSVWGGGTGSARLFELTNSASTTLMHVLENGTAYFLGNIGVGTTSPYASLSVAGASGIVANKIYATSTTATSTFSGNVYIGGTTVIDNAQLGNLSFDTDAGTVAWSNLPISTNVPSNTVESYSANIDDFSVLTLFSQADGSGRAKNIAVGISTTSPFHQLDILAGSTTPHTTGKTANYYGINVHNQATSTTASINKAGINIRSTGSWTGTLANNIGLLVSSVTGGTNNYDAVFNGGGNVGVGTSSPWRTLAVSGTVAFNGLTAAAGTPHTLCMDSTTKEVTFNNSSNCTVSSARFKHDIQTLDVGLNEVMRLKPVSFEYNGTSGQRVGFLAEDVVLVEPRLVFYEEDGTTVRGVRYEEITSLLTKAVQELNQKVDLLSINTGNITATSSNPILTETIVAAIGAFFDSIGAKFADGVASFRKLAAETFTIGSKEKPTGIVLFDEEGTPYCLRLLKGGVVSTTPTDSDGECPNADDTDTPDDPEVSDEDDNEDDGHDVVVGDDNNDNENETATSTVVVDLDPDTSTTTPAVGGGDEQDTEVPNEPTDENPEPESEQEVSDEPVVEEPEVTQQPEEVETTEAAESSN